MNDREPPGDPVPVKFGGYRCRVHLDRAVTWRGTSCPECPPPGVKRPKQRQRTNPTITEEYTQ